jgi:hypothetical protein
VASAREVLDVSRAVLNGQDGWVAVLRAYMDESGTHGGSPVVTVGLYVGKPRTWEAWTKDWNANKKPIKVFHAVDCHNRTEEFDGWDRPTRDAYAARLLPVLGRHPIMGILIGIHMDTFKLAMAPYPELRVMFGTPYTACFQWTVQTLIAMMDERGDRQRVAFFHESNDYEKEAEAAFAYVKAEKLLTKRIVSLTFGGKDDYVPLQAADTVAYEGNHLLRDPSKPERKPWKAMNPGADSDPEKRRIRVLHFGRDNMDWLIAKLSDFRSRLLAAGWDGKVV